MSGRSARDDGERRDVPSPGHTDMPESERVDGPRQPALLQRQRALHRPRASSNLSDSSARARERRREPSPSTGSLPASPVSYGTPVHRQGSQSSQLSASSVPPTPSSHSVEAGEHASLSDESVYSDDDGASAAPSLKRTVSGQSGASVPSPARVHSPSVASIRSVSGRGAPRSEAPPLPLRSSSLAGGTASPSTSSRVASPAQPAASASTESLSSAYSDDAKAPIDGPAPMPRAASGASSMRSPLSDTSSTMQELLDTFASALVDLGLDDAPLDGLADVDVQYRPAAYPGGSHGLPSSASTLASLLPPNVRAPSTASAAPTTEASVAPPAESLPASSMAPVSVTPVSAAPVPPSDEPSSSAPDQIEVYGLSVWWPGSFDVTTNANYDSVTHRAALYADAANDLYTRPTHLDVWMERAKQQRPSAPDALTTMVMQTQRRALEAQLQPSPGSASADLPLPTNIPYPLLAKAQSAAHSDPGLLLATPATNHARPTTRLGHASTLMQTLNLSRRKTPLTTASATLPSARGTPSVRSVRGMPSATPHGTSAPSLPPRLAPRTEAPLGLGILPRTPSAMSAAPPTERPDVPEAQLQAGIARLRDALPDIDEATARRYVVRCHGDDVRAITEYLHEQARDDVPKRGLFARTPRAR
ncbi:hypothetical protein MNAN1_001886 [Malassezia nana]|uniref:Uncharacterized protein n=1 Tax=Malassezia nana TaxID=180528 RepID=A0AAF0ERH7_9BASI|nr:hypothetical protein MNAN1_001886 [Malassezia nana]